VFKYTILSVQRSDGESFSASYYFHPRICVREIRIHSQHSCQRFNSRLKGNKSSQVFALSCRECRCRVVWPGMQWRDKTRECHSYFSCFTFSVNFWETNCLPNGFQVIVDEKDPLSLDSNLSPDCLVHLIYDTHHECPSDIFCYEWLNIIQWFYSSCFYLRQCRLTWEMI